MSLLTLALVRLHISSDQLFVIRLQQLFGLLALMYLYVALIVSPLSALLGKQRLSGLIHARRAIGVSACYFALLHGAVALWGQLGGVTQLAYLPAIFTVALVLGTMGVLMLLVMAATSFDGVVQRMTFVHWKRLHRFIYLGGVAILLHVWMVGTHLAYTQVQVAFGALLIMLLGLESYRTLTALRKKQVRADFIINVLTLWAILAASMLLIASIVPNYHSRHTDHRQEISQ